MEFSLKIVVACYCILHNICLENGEDGEDLYKANEEIDIGEALDVKDQGRNIENRRAHLF